MRIDFNSYPEVSKAFYEYFHTSFHPFFNALYTVALRRIYFDAVLFDDYLHKLYGDFESQRKSTFDIITEKYGKEACEFIRKIL